MQENDWTTEAISDIGKKTIKNMSEKGKHRGKNGAYVPFEDERPDVLNKGLCHRHSKPYEIQSSILNFESSIKKVPEALGS